MRCLPSLLVALISAVAAAVLAGFISDAATTAHHVSNMEGGRGWLILICIALSFLVGGAIGVIATRVRVKGFIYALVTALVADAGLAVVAGAVAMLTADSAPRIDGHRLHLEFEVMLPAGEPVPKESENTLTVMATGFIDESYPMLHQAQATQRDGRVVVPGSMPITSHNEHRELSVRLGRDDQQDFELKLPPSPRKEDEAWSEWRAPHREAASLPLAKEREVAVRYRVQPD
jgi:hypothetical protein